MSILLVRHGETPSNAARVLQMPETPLSERGLAQAARLAERLAKLGVTAIVASDYARAQATAEQVQRITGAPLELWPELRERHFGELRGRAYDEIGDDIFALDFAPPGGEPWPEFNARVARAWQRVTARALETPGNLVVISHGLFCRSVVEHLVPRAADLAVPAHWANTSVTVFGSAPPHEIALLNCSTHLESLETVTDANSGAV